MKTKFLIIAVLTGFLNSSAFAQSKITVREFQKVIGKWNGKLAYLDYQSNKPYEMPANLEVTQIGKSSQFKFVNSYPNESSANSIDTIAISNDGKFLDNEHIKSKKAYPNGNFEIITEIVGKDGNDNKDAVIRHTYLISETIFEIKKEVKFSDSKRWILRHTYEYRRDSASR